MNCCNLPENFEWNPLIRITFRFTNLPIKKTERRENHNDQIVFSIK